MKTNVLMKIAVVFMAAFGAYAFSGSNANELRPFKIKEGGMCTNILAGCSDSGDYTCTILVLDTPIPVYDLDCNKVVRHSSPNYAQWAPIP